MKPNDIVLLVVRLSGYYLVFWGIQSLLVMILGGGFEFRPLLVYAAKIALGVAIARMAPTVTALLSPEEQPE